MLEFNAWGLWYEIRKEYKYNHIPKMRAMPDRETGEPKEERAQVKVAGSGMKDVFDSVREPVIEIRAVFLGQQLPRLQDAAEVLSVFDAWTYGKLGQYASRNRALAGGRVTYGNVKVNQADQDGGKRKEQELLEFRINMGGKQYAYRYDVIMVGVMRQALGKLVNAFSVDSICPTIKDLQLPKPWAKYADPPKAAQPPQKNESPAPRVRQPAPRVRKTLPKK